MKPPLYSRSGKASAAAVPPPSLATERIDERRGGGVDDAASRTAAANDATATSVGGRGFAAALAGGRPLQGANRGGSRCRSHDELLESARRFSAFAVHHVEEARMELSLPRRIVAAADDGNGDGQEIGGCADAVSDSRCPELPAAFEQLANAYDRLSLLQWNAARRAYEEACRGSYLLPAEEEEEEEEDEEDAAGAGTGAEERSASGNGPHHCLGLDLQMSERGGRRNRRRGGGRGTPAPASASTGVTHSEEEARGLVGSSGRPRRRGGPGPGQFRAATAVLGMDESSEQRMGTGTVPSASPTNDANAVGGAADVDSWFAAAFRGVPFSSEAESIPMSGPGPNPFAFSASAPDLAQAQAQFTPPPSSTSSPPPPRHAQEGRYDYTPSRTTAAVPPPGFEERFKEERNPSNHADGQADTDGEIKWESGEDADTNVYADDSSKADVDDKESTGSTSAASSSSRQSDISSLAHPESLSSELEADSASSSSTSRSSFSAESTTPSVSLPPPRIENVDYVYMGGYATRVSDGKETHGVVPRSTRRAAVDPAVSVIEEGAFHGCSGLESIVIHPAVISIGDHAFRKCSALKSVVFLAHGNSNSTNGRKRDTMKKSRSKQRPKFGKDDSNGNSKAEQQPLTIPPDAKTTPSSASGMQSPSSRLRTVGDWAFFNCSSLSTLDLPRGVERVGARAFQRCSALSDVTLPDTLTSVGENAFHGCPREAKAALERWEKRGLMNGGGMIGS